MRVFQYEASTEGRLVSPVLETKASSVDRHAPPPTPDPPMFGPGLMGISEMVAGYFREQEERMNRIEDEIERPQGIERGLQPDVVTMGGRSIDQKDQRKWHAYS